MRLIVGLGNPGKRYRGTRHNVGAEVIERLAEKKGAGLKRKWRLKASVARVTIGGRAVTIAVPRTFMNASGEAVAALMRREKSPASELLVVSDDINLLLGRMRIRRRGGPGGHNGLKSVVARIGTEDFARLRVGVGPARHDWVGHVLGRFSQEERKAIDEVCERAVEAVEEIVQGGLEAAMNKFNPARE